MSESRTALELFAGAGGGILGGLLLGHSCVCAVEINPYRQKVLKARQEDGVLPRFPIFGDVRDFDGPEWRGKVDIVSGGIPCQPFSRAGKQKGENDERNMWPDTARIIGEVRPGIVFLENVPALLAHRYFGRILGDLAALGYDAVWDCISASSVGAPHQRDRLWIMAYDKTDRRGPGRQRGSATGRSGEPESVGTLQDVAYSDEEIGGADSRGPERRADRRNNAQGHRSHGGGIVGAPGHPDASCSDNIDADDSGPGSGPDGRERTATQALREKRSHPDEERRFRGSAERPEQDAEESARVNVAKGGHPGRTLEPVVGGLAHELADRLDEFEFATGRELRQMAEWWSVDPSDDGGIPRVISKCADRVAQIEALGDGQVPLVHAVAFRRLEAATRRGLTP